MSTQPVPALTYTQVRMLAEATLAVEGTATFTFNPNGSFGPELVPPNSTTPLQGVVASVRNQTVYSQATGLVLSVGNASLDVKTVYQADAVFWTDAAVQKFVLPYDASCMGYNAWKGLTALQAAWNGAFPGIQVFALMHVPPGQVAGGITPGSPAPVEPLWVLYLENGAIQATSLSTFRPGGQIPDAPLELPAAPSVMYTPPQPPPAGSTLPGYTGLRAMAEWGESIAAEPMYFPYNPVTRRWDRPLPQMPPDPGPVMYFPVFNPDMPPGTQPPTVVLNAPRPAFVPPESGVPVGMSIDLTAPPLFADAVFLSTGAIEQFMLPYYASLDGFAGLADLQVIEGVWSAAADGEVLGLVHLPRSDWVWVEEVSASLQETAVVHPDPVSGGFRVTRTVDFIRGR